MSSAGHSDVSVTRAREIPVIKSLLCLRELFFFHLPSIQSFNTQTISESEEGVMLIR